MYDTYNQRIRECIDSHKDMCCASNIITILQE